MVIYLQGEGGGAGMDMRVNIHFSPCNDIPLIMINNYMENKEDLFHHEKSLCPLHKIVYKHLNPSF